MQLSGQTLIAAAPAESGSVSELHHRHQLAQLTQHTHFSPLAAHHLKFGNTLLMMKSSHMTSMMSSPINDALKSKEESLKREVANSSPISISVDSNRTPSPASSTCNGKSDHEDDERISVSSPIKPHASPISNYPSVPSHIAKAYGAYASLGQHLPGQFPYPFGFPFPYAHQYDLTFANGLLSQGQQSSPNSQPSPKQNKPSTNFSVASLLGSKDDSDSKRQSKGTKRIARHHNSSYSEGEEEEEEDIDEELLEESVAAAAAAAAATDDEDEEAVDMSARAEEDRKISVTRLTPSPSPHQLSPPSSSRSASPLSPGYLKSTNGQMGKNLPHPMDSMSAALQLQLAAAAAARHRFTVDGLMHDSHAAPGQGPTQPHSGMFGPHGHHPHPHSMLHSGANVGNLQTPPGWMAHPGAHPALGGLPGAHPLNPFTHWLAQTSGPMSPSQSKYFFQFHLHFVVILAVLFPP